MEKILKKNEPDKRVFASTLTIGIIERADIPIAELQRLKSEGFNSTKDFWIMRAIMNAALIQGAPITEDEPFETVTELQEEFTRFLGKGRMRSTREKLREKRTPRR